MMEEEDDGRRTWAKALRACEFLHFDCDLPLFKENYMRYVSFLFVSFCFRFVRERKRKKTHGVVLYDGILFSNYIGATRAKMRRYRLKECFHSFLCFVRVVENAKKVLYVFRFYVVFRIVVRFILNEVIVEVPYISK